MREKKKKEIYLCFKSMIDSQRLFLWGVFCANKSASSLALAAVPILTTRWQSAPPSSKPRAAIFDSATTLTCRLETCPQETLIIASHSEAGACSSATGSMFAVSTALLPALTSGIFFFLHGVFFFQAHECLLLFFAVRVSWRGLFLHRWR